MPVFLGWISNVWAMGATVHKNDKSGSVSFQRGRRENLNISCCLKFLEIRIGSDCISHSFFFCVCLCHFLMLHKTLTMSVIYCCRKHAGRRCRNRVVLQSAFWAKNNNILFFGLVYTLLWILWLVETAARKIKSRMPSFYVSATAS